MVTLEDFTGSGEVGELVSFVSIFTDKYAATHDGVYIRDDKTVFVRFQVEPGRAIVIVNDPTGGFQKANARLDVPAAGVVVKLLAGDFVVKEGFSEYLPARVKYVGFQKLTSDKRYLVVEIRYPKDRQHSKADL